MYNEYEAIFIINKNEDAEKIKEVINEIISNNKYVISKKEDIGLKKLAYSVKGHTEGYYYFLTFNKNIYDNDNIDKIKTKINTIEEIIKFIIIKIKE